MSFRFGSNHDFISNSNHGGTEAKDPEESEKCYVSTVHAVGRSREVKVEELVCGLRARVQV